MRLASSSRYISSNEDRGQVAVQTVQLMQQDDLIAMQTTSRGTVDIPGGTRVPLTLEEGGYHWHGELRLWDNGLLIDDGGVASKGSLHFGLHTHGEDARGIWTGTSHDGDLLSGWGALGKSEEQVVRLVNDLKVTRGVKALRTAAAIEGDPDDE